MRLYRSRLTGMGLDEQYRTKNVVVAENDLPAAAVPNLSDSKMSDSERVSRVSVTLPRTLSKTDNRDDEQQ